MDALAQAAAAELAARSAQPAANGSAAAASASPAVPNSLAAAAQAELANRARNPGASPADQAPQGQAPAAAAQPSGFAHILNLAEQAPYFGVGIAAAEAGANMATGMGGAVLGGLRGLAETGWNKLENELGTKPSFSNPAADVAGPANALTYQPRGELGQIFSQAAGYPFGLLGRAAHWAGGKVDDTAARYMTPEHAAALSTAVDTGINSLPLLAGGIRPWGRPTVTNIGLKIGDNVALQPSDVIGALQRQGAKVKGYTMGQSATEPTVIARTAMPLSAKSASALSTELHQDAIAQSGPEGASLYGPKAADGGPFKPEFFLNPDGKPTALPLGDEDVVAGRRLGLKFTPEQIGKETGTAKIGRTVQSLTEHAKLERALSVNNAGAVDRAVAQQIGIPQGTEISPESIDAARAPWNAVYKEAASTGPIDATSLKPDARNLVRQAASQMGLPSVDFAQMDGNTLVQAVRQLRAQGFKYQRSSIYNPSFDMTGRRMLGAANALEDALDTHANAAVQSQLPLGDQPAQGELFSSNPPPRAVAPDLVPRLREARQNLAQIASAENALRPGNHFNGLAFAKMLKQKVPLSGNMKLIGTLAGKYDRVFQDTSKIRNSGPFSALDFLAGLAAGAVHWPLAAGIAARPLARGALESNWYQDSLAGVPHVRAPLSPIQSVVRRAARPLPLMGPLAQPAGDRNIGQAIY